MSLAHHKTAFVQFSKKFVRASLTETLKIPDAVIYGGESPYESLVDAVQFWRDMLMKDKIWTEFTCAHIYDELMTRILEDIDQLNLSYRVEKGIAGVVNRSGAEILSEKADVKMEDDQNPASMVVQYIANNNTDQ